MSQMEASDQCRSFLREICINMITELQEKQSQLMEIYKSNPTFPFDFYNLSLRETDTRIQAIRELYKKNTEEDLT
jgi:hypothetical protein